MTYLQIWANLSGVSYGRIAAKVGVDPTNMGRIIRGKNGLTIQVARRIVRAFPEIDRERLYKDIAVYRPDTEEEREALSKALASLDVQGPL